MGTRSWSQPQTQFAESMRERELQTDRSTGISPDLRRILKDLVKDVVNLIPWNESQWDVVKRLYITISQDGSRSASACVFNNDVYRQWRLGSASDTPKVPPGAHVVIDYGWLVDLQRMNEIWFGAPAFHDSISQGDKANAATKAYHQFVKNLLERLDMDVGDWDSYSELYQAIDRSEWFQEFKRRVVAFNESHPIDSVHFSCEAKGAQESFLWTKAQLAFSICHEVGHFFCDHFRAHDVKPTNCSEEFGKIVASRVDEFDADRVAIGVLTQQQSRTDQKLMFISSLFRFYNYYVIHENNLSFEEFNSHTSDHPPWATRQHLLLDSFDKIMSESIEPVNLKLVKGLVRHDLSLCLRTSALFRGYSHWLKHGMKMTGKSYYSAYPGNPDSRDTPIKPPTPTDFTGAADWYSRGVKYGNEGNHQKAKDSFRSAIAQNDGYQDAWTNLGVSCIHTGDYPEGEEALRRAIGMDPNDRYAWQALTNILSLQGKNEESKSCYEETLRLMGRKQ